LTSLDELPGDLNAHAVDADVVDVVRLVKDDHAVPRQLLAHHLSNLPKNNVQVILSSYFHLVHF
jgi:hypothetical protein